MELQGAMTRLQEATINGNVASLLQLLSEHPHIFDIERYYFKKSTLKVALKLGHLDFAKTIIVEKPELAEELIMDHSPSSFTSALHICSEKGYLEMVRTLIKNSSGISSMCLAQDSDGRNPVHLAAIGGHQEVVRVLLETMPMAGREHTSQAHGGETVLHLCVKYGQYETLAFLIDEINVGDLLNSTDIHGNTILHLAVSSKQPQIVKYLVKKKGIKNSAVNKNGLTAMDICTKSSKDKKHSDIWIALRLVNALSSKNLSKKEPFSWLEKQRNALMVVASLIATMAFQLGVNPPGGIWQDDEHGHVAGESVLGYQSQLAYYRLLIVNSIGFISSLSVILLLISGLPLRRFFMVILMITMWIAVAATTFSYSFSLIALADSNSDFEPLITATIILVFIWLGVTVCIPFIHVIRYLVKVIKRKKFVLIYFFTRQSTSSSVV